MIPDVLSYAAKRRPQKRAITRRTWIVLGLSGLFLLIVFTVPFGPTSGEIRIDTGDLRYCWFGIPMKYRPMPEPYRSQLLALSARRPAIPPRWERCVTYPLPSSNNSDLMCRGFYHSVAIWSGEDANIARWALDEVASYITSTGAASGLPRSCHILNGFVIDWHTGTLPPDWRNLEEVKDYCAEHSYTPPPAPKVSGATIK